MRNCQRCKGLIELPTPNQRFCSLNCRWPDYESRDHYKVWFPKPISYAQRLKDWEKRETNIKSKK